MIDLSCNHGGYVSAAVSILSWMLGTSSLQLTSSVSGAECVTNYCFDADRDHRFDPIKDRVSDKRLFCLVSPLSFSCGNLVPAMLKSARNVMILGRISSGGGCTTQKLSLADGSLIQISGRVRLSVDMNGVFSNVDTGIEPDRVLIDPEEYYDREKLTKLIRGLL